MHRKSLGVSLTLTLLTLAAIVATTSVTAAADHWLGTWKLNLARSKYNPPELAPKSQTITREAVEGGMKLVSDGVDSQGRPTHNEYTAKFDNKDYPWTGQTNADTISLIRLDEEYYESTWKLKGEVTITAQTVVSRDGKTLTTNQFGKDAQGRTISNMTVYDKQ
jgi:hypothetical protein